MKFLQVFYPKNAFSLCSLCLLQHAKNYSNPSWIQPVYTLLPAMCAGQHCWSLAQSRYLHVYILFSCPPHDGPWAASLRPSDAYPGCDTGHQLQPTCHIYTAVGTLTSADPGTVALVAHVEAGWECVCQCTTLRRFASVPPPPGDEHVWLSEQLLSGLWHHPGRIIDTTAPHTGAQFPGIRTESTSTLWYL